tara:strand:- start:29125 stop:30474 length:1350 start_codon:yes stop_codon:yes gene_type:complete
MKFFNKAALAFAVASICYIPAISQAGVSAEEAAKLKTTLTPLGAEKAGNADGSIPAWDGKSAPQVAKLNTGHSADPYAAEKPLFFIDANNSGQYVDKLSQGTIELMKKYPSFRVDVYPTHRTAAAPRYVYENTYTNATRASLGEDGEVKNAFGGVPFPIPKSGEEVIWNHILHPRISSSEFGLKNVVGSSNGRWTIATRAENNNQSPYYSRNGSAEKWSGDYLLARFVNTDPPFKAGEALVIRDNVSLVNSRQAWQYLVGQRRVRRAPTVAYDTPDFVASGANYFDEVIGFYGSPDRYSWKLLGKKEMYIPYNTNGFQATPMDDAMVPFHFNPDKVRWELHRVWVVEATVAAGKRHVLPKRTFYFDEDTWAVSMIDGYDAEGKLWRSSYVMPTVEPDYPIVIADTTFVYDLQAKTFSCVQCFNEEYFRVVDDKPNSFFTGASMGASGLR